MNIECNQCGYQHPPLTADMGGKCPMAKNNAVEVNGEKIMANDLMDSVRNIIQDQIKVRGIKDVEQLRKFLVINIAKLMTEFKEE